MVGMSAKKMQSRTCFFTMSSPVRLSSSVMLRYLPEFERAAVFPQDILNSSKLPEKECAKRWRYGTKYKNPTLYTNKIIIVFHSEKKGMMA